jgi:hypothetical protein
VASALFPRINFILAENTRFACFATSRVRETSVASREKLNKFDMSGKIIIENDVISWTWKNETLAVININQIVAIGEYTLESLNDDWFLIFILRDGSWKRVSMFVDNIGELLVLLSKKFDDYFLETQLANSTSWNSKVSYPKSLRGENLFSLVEGKINFSDNINDLISASH